MEKPTLTEYLAQIIKLESSVFTLGDTIRGLYQKINSLEYAINNEEKPKMPKNEIKHLSIVDVGLGLWVLGAFIGGFLGFSIGFTLYFPLIGFIAGSVLGFFVAYLVSCIPYKKQMRHEREEQEKYEQQLQAYQEEAEQYQKWMEGELAQVSNLRELCGTMEQELTETKEVLAQLYGENVIFPKYRNLVAVCSLYEYLMSGRCTRLTGHDGAYNIYENEVRLDRILTKIDMVVQRLDQIKENQWMLYDTIRQGNEISQRVLAESIRQSRLLGSVAENSAVAAYQAEIAANNSAANAMIGVANYLKE